jgi:hypothetical protein
MELRWIIRNGWDGPERVLQYRDVGGLALGGWLDVPTAVDGIVPQAEQLVGPQDVSQAK